MHPYTSQGQLHMWVDMFRKEGRIPPPIDVSPRKPEKYVLRVVVRNCEILQDVSEVTGEEMNDLYVKGYAINLPLGLNINTIARKLCFCVILP